MDKMLEQKAKHIKESSLFINPSDGAELLDKQNIFLVLAGLKPMSEVFSGHWEQVSPTRRRTKADDPNEIGAFLNSLGLKYSLRLESNATVATIALSQEIIDRTNTLVNEATEQRHVTRESQAEIGALYGFPPTAVKGFIKNLILDNKTQEKVVQEAGLPGYFVGFFLSKDHYREELTIMKERYELLRQYGLVVM